MAKVTDLNEIRAMATENLAQHGTVLTEYFTIEEATTIMTMIYITNDITAGFGQDYLNNPSIVSSPTRIAVIYQGHMSFYQVDCPICDYEDLMDDLDYIRVTLDAAFSRWEAQNT